MSVDDWARREVLKDAEDWPVDYEAEAGAGNAFMRGIVHAFDALLSDEAVEAAARSLSGTAVWSGYEDDACAALQAAVRAVIEGESRDDV